MTRFSTFQIQWAKVSSAKRNQWFILISHSIIFLWHISVSTTKVWKIWKGPREPHEGQVQGPAPESRPSQAVQVGWVERGLRAALRRRTWSCGWMRASTWPICKCNEYLQPKSQPNPGLHHKKGDQQVERSDPVTSLSWEPPPGVLHPAVDPQTANLFLY